MSRTMGDPDGSCLFLSLVFSGMLLSFPTILSFCTHHLCLIFQALLFFLCLFYISKLSLLCSVCPTEQNTVYKNQFWLYKIICMFLTTPDALALPQTIWK